MYKNKSDQVKYYNNNRDIILLKKKIYYLNNRIIKLRKAVEYRNKLKLEIITHYSPEKKCSICGNKNLDVLSIDHINGGGCKEMKLGNYHGGSGLHQKIKRENFPIVYRVLCLNCNWKEHIIKIRKNTQQNKYSKKIKLDVLKHYSNNKLICNYCGCNDIDVLCLDHINNDGTEERNYLLSKYHMHGGPQFYSYLKRNKFPEGYQVLCRNCNWEKKLRVYNIKETLN